MQIIAQRTIAAYLAATAIAVAVLLIITPLIHDGSPDYPIWKILNYFMAVAAVFILAIGWYRKYSLCKNPAQHDTLAQLTANFAFYGAIVLTMLFFWEWFWTLNPDSETGEAVTSHIIYFPAMDSLFTVLGLVTARYLWTCTKTPTP